MDRALAGEHEQIRKHLAALRAGGLPAADWLAILRAMRQLVEQHAAEEERVVLPEFAMTFGLERLRELGDEYARWTTEVESRSGLTLPAG